MAEYDVVVLSPDAIRQAAEPVFRMPPPPDRCNVNHHQASGPSMGQTFRQLVDRFVVQPVLSNVPPALSAHARRQPPPIMARSNTTPWEAMQRTQQRVDHRVGWAMENLHFRVYQVQLLLVGMLEMAFAAVDAVALVAAVATPATRAANSVARGTSAQGGSLAGGAGAPVRKQIIRDVITEEQGRTRTDYAATQIGPIQSSSRTGGTPMTLGPASNQRIHELEIFNLIESQMVANGERKAAPDGVRVIELGSGKNLTASTRLTRQGAHVTAVDPKFPTEGALQEFYQAGGAKFVCGTAADIPDHSADHVVQYFRFPMGERMAQKDALARWITHDIDEAVEDSMRILRRGDGPRVITFVTEDRYTVEELAERATELGNTEVFLVKGPATQVAPGAGGEVPSEILEKPVYLLNIYPQD